MDGDTAREGGGLATAGRIEGNTERARISPPLVDDDLDRIRELRANSPTDADPARHQLPYQLGRLQAAVAEVTDVLAELRVDLDPVVVVTRQMPGRVRPISDTEAGQCQVAAQVTVFAQQLEALAEQVMGWRAQLDL